MTWKLVSHRNTYYSIFKGRYELYGFFGMRVRNHIHPKRTDELDVTAELYGIALGRGGSHHLPMLAQILQSPSH